MVDLLDLAGRACVCIVVISRRGLHVASMAYRWASHEVRGLSCGRVDGVAATWHRVDAIDATTPRFRRVRTAVSTASRSHEDAIAAITPHLRRVLS